MSEPWICPECKQETMVMIEATYKESSKWYCTKCKKEIDFGLFIDANADRMVKKTVT